MRADSGVIQSSQMVDYKFDFGTGNTNPETFPSEAFAKAAGRVIPGLSESLSHYPGKYGHEGLRRLMADREFDREGVRVDPQNMILTNGSMQAITLIAQTFCRHENSCIVMEEFCYPGSVNAFADMGIDMVGVPCDDHGMQTSELESILSTLVSQDRKPGFIYTLPTYQNPTGTVMPVERRRELLDVARKFGCILVEDNCYADVHYDGEKPPALYAMASDVRHIYLSSLSKIFAPGIRLGYLIAEPPLLNEILPHRHDAGPNTLAAAVTEEYLRGQLWQHIDRTNAALKLKRDAMLNALETHCGNLCSYVSPAGGLFIWVQLAGSIDADRLEKEAEASSLRYLPGRNFHINGNDVPYIRLAFGYPSVSEIEAGIRQLAECMKRSNRD